MNPTFQTWETGEELERCARLLRESGLFDAGWYAAQRGSELTGGSAEADYLLFGEKAGLRPSASFDPRFYDLTYPALPDRPQSPLLRHILCRNPADRPTSADACLERISKLQRTIPWTPALDQPEISYCIPVMGRLDDLKGTLPGNLAEHAGMAGRVEFIVMIFDSGDETHDWVLGRFPQQIASGLLRPIISRDLASWHFGRAKNAFRPHVRGRLISSLDADNFVTKSQTESLLRLSDQTCGFAMVHHFSGAYGDGSSGRLTMPASVYRLTGYDERLLPRQFDEMAAILRALQRFPFLPFHYLASAGNLFDRPGAMADFRRAEQLEFACRQIDLSPGPAPLNPRGPDYAKADRELHWAGIFNGAQCRYALSKDARARRDMQMKAIWAARELAKCTPAGKLAAMLFQSVPVPATGLSMVALYQGYPEFLPRFCAHHFALGVTRIVLVLPEDPGPECLPALPAGVETVICRTGVPETTATLWLEVAFRCVVPEGHWGMVMETSELLRLPPEMRAVSAAISMLETTGRDRLYALAAHVIAEDAKGAPRFFRATGKSPSPYRRLAPVARDFGSRADVSWHLDAGYHLAGEAGAVRRLVLMRNRPGVHLDEARRSVHFQDSLCREDPWSPSKPQAFLHDYGYLLSGKAGQLLPLGGNA